MMYLVFLFILLNFWQIIFFFQAVGCVLVLY